MFDLKGHFFHGFYRRKCTRTKLEAMTRPWDCFTEFYWVFHHTSNEEARSQTRTSQWYSDWVVIRFWTGLKGDADDGGTNQEDFQEETIRFSIDIHFPPSECSRLRLPVFQCPTTSTVRSLRFKKKIFFALHLFLFCVFFFSFPFFYPVGSDFFIRSVFFRLLLLVRSSSLIDWTTVEGGGRALINRNFRRWPRIHQESPASWRASHGRFRRAVKQY